MTIFEKSYFEMPVREGKSQCSLDLESGKISICEVPFEYRDAYRYSKAAEYIKSTKEAEKEIEKEVFRIQLLNDIAESRRVRKKVREADLMAAYEEFFLRPFESGSWFAVTNLVKEWRMRKEIGEG